MKKMTHIVRKALGMGVFLVALSVAAPSFADNGKSANKGYWVVESDNNLKTSIVRLYNSNDEMVHEEKLEGKTITLSPRNVKKLNRLLDSYINNRLLELALR